MARAFIGTSGWNYKHWRGIIYPQGLTQRQWLPFVAERFDTVEINTSFYSIPKASSVESWAAATPPHYLFAFKLWRGITHYRKLHNSGDMIRRFLEMAEVMPPEKRAPILVQLPPSQGLNIPKLREWIEEFRSIAVSPWRLAVEFRNPAWITPETHSMLDGMQTALCVHDMAGRADIRAPNSAPFVYVRRHGSGHGRYAGRYPSQALDEDAADIRKWISEGRDVYVYYNNDIGGHAFFNALDLKRLVEDSGR